MIQVGLWDHTALLVRRTPSRGQRAGILEGGSVSHGTSYLDNVFAPLPNQVHHPHWMNCLRSFDKVLLLFHPNPTSFPRAEHRKLKLFDLPSRPAPVILSIFIQSSRVLSLKVVI